MAASSFLTEECEAGRHEDCALCPPPGSGPPRLCRCSCHRVDYGQLESGLSAHQAQRNRGALLIMAGVLAVMGLIAYASTGSPFGIALLFVAALALGLGRWGPGMPRSRRRR